MLCGLQVEKERGALRKALDAVDSKAVSWYRDGLVTGESVPALRARLLQDLEAPRGRSGVKPYRCDELGCTYAFGHQRGRRYNTIIGRSAGCENF